MTNKTNTITAAAERIAADTPEGFDPFRLVNVTSITTEADAERIAQAVAFASEQATTRHTERTITAKTNVGLMIFAAAKARCASDESGKTTMPDVKLATVGKLGKILGLTDTPAKDERGATERFGYRLGTLGACVDLARGVIAGVDSVARDRIADSGESVTEKSLRTAILAQVNPDAARNRTDGARNLAAAKIAAAAGRKAGAIVKVGETAVKVDAEMLNKVRATTSASLLTDAALAAASDAQLTATLRAIQLVIAAREAGAVKAPKAPAKPKAKATPKA